MPASFTPGSTVTLDESDSLQNAIATPTPAEDANDNDILVASLPTTFTGRLTAVSAPTPTKAAVSGYAGSGSGTNAFTKTTTFTNPTSPINQKFFTRSMP